MIKLKISCIIIVVSSSAPLISSALIPLLSLLSGDFPFVRLSIACVCLAHRLQHHRQHGRKCYKILLHCPSRLLFHRSHLSEDLCRISRKCWHCLSSLLRWMFPDSFLKCALRNVSGLGLCDRSYAFDFSKNIEYFVVSFGSFVVSDSLFDLLTDVSHLSLVFSVHFSSFDEGQEPLVFAVHRFFFARCRYSCVRSSISLFVCDRRRRRRMLLLNYFCHTCFCCRRYRRVLLLKYFRSIVCCCRRRRRVLLKNFRRSGISGSSCAARRSVHFLRKKTGSYRKSIPNDNGLYHNNCTWWFFEQKNDTTPASLPPNIGDNFDVADSQVSWCKNYVCSMG